MRTTKIICLLLLTVTSFSQNIDSLKTALKNAKSDTTKCNILYAIVNSDSEESESYLDSYLKLAQTGNTKFYKRHLAQAFIFKGCSFSYAGNIAEAISLFSKSIKIQEEIGNKKDMTQAIANVAVLYRIQGDIDASLSQLEKAYSISEEIKNIGGQIYALVNMGEAYVEKKDYKQAEISFSKSLDLSIKSNDYLQTSSSYYGLGLVAAREKEYDKSIEFYTNGLYAAKKSNDKYAIQRGLSSLAANLSNQGKYKEALRFALESMEIAKQNGMTYNIMQAAAVLKVIYSKLNQPASELEAYKLYIQMRDSVNSQENRKAVIRNQVKTEYEKKALADSLRAENIKSKIVMENEIEMNRQQNQKMVLYIGLALVIVFSFILFNRFQLTKKQKQVIEHHQKEITDSINYAKRLQEAILPTQKQFDSLLPENFVLYKPKDIVAGDFYWLENVGDTVFFAAADCTGHGVPGAMVSMVCSNALTRVVLEYGITEPGKILDEVRKIVVSTFEKSGSDIKDGMDISLCALNKNTNELKWAGANNPLWYLQGGKMNEVKADKQPIGKCDNPKPFTTQSILLQKGDSVFIFTDGYADQFGGPKGKKFKYKQLETILLNGATDGVEKGYDAPSMNKQRTELSWAFDTWKGELEQVDDVCVIGVRV